ncbi:MAG: AIR synthase related protein [Eubacterium sp.]
MKNIGESMKRGKFSEPALKRSVLKGISKDNEFVMNYAGIGVDAARVKICGDALICTHTVNYAIQNSELYAVTKCVNNICAAGGRPVAVSVYIGVPESAGECALKKIVSGLDDACRIYGISISSGHTETISDGYDFIVVVTAIGDIDKNIIGYTKNKDDAQEFDIVMTKAIGIEGTAIIATEKEQELSERFSPSFLSQARDFIKHISIMKDAEVAMQFGVHYMHDVSSNGIYGALWELASFLGTGIEINHQDIPVWQHTIELTELYDINPYNMMSGGSLVIATDNGNALVEEFLQHQIQAAVIGKTTHGNDKVIVNGEEKRYLEPPRGDEIYKIYK